MGTIVILQTFEGHDSSVLRAEFISQGMQLVTAGADGLLKLWSIKTSECTATFDDHDGRIWAFTGLYLMTWETTFVSVVSLLYVSYTGHSWVLEVCLTLNRLNSHAWMNKQTNKQKTHFMYLCNKDIYCVFKTCHTISFLLSTQCHLFNNFISFCSNKSCFHKSCAKI